MKINLFINKNEGEACPRFYLPVFRHVDRFGVEAWVFPLAIPVLIWRIFKNMFLSLWRDLLEFLYLLMEKKRTPMTQSHNQQQESWELPKNWRYNAKELRMEHQVPCYDENEEFERHVWVALVPDDIKQAISTERQRLLDEVRELVEDKKTAWLKANEHEFYGKGVTEQIQDVVVEAFSIDLLSKLKEMEQS